MKMESCYDCKECKVILRVIYGHIQYTKPITMKCAKGLWKDEDGGNSVTYKGNSLVVLNKQLKTPVPQQYFNLCAERRLNGEEFLNNID